MALPLIDHASVDLDPAPGSADVFLASASHIVRCNELELLSFWDNLDAGIARFETPAAPSVEHLNAVLSTVSSISRIKSRSKKAAVDRGRIVGLARQLALAGWARHPAQDADYWLDQRLCDGLKLTRSESLARALFDTPGTLEPWRVAGGRFGGSWAHGALGQMVADGWLAGALIASASLTPEIIRVASTRSDSFFFQLLNSAVWSSVGGASGARQLATAWMEKGWHVDSAEPRLGQSALHKACAPMHPGAINLLLELGANPALCDFEGRSALHALSNSCSPGALECGERLIRAGADPFALDTRGQTAHDLALASNSRLVPLLAPLFAAQAEAQALSSSIERSDAELGSRLRALMDRGHRLVTPEGTLLDTPSDIMNLSPQAQRPRRLGL